jgi:hypothetical protein
MKPAVSGCARHVATFALGWLIAAQLYQVSAYDPVLLGGATVLLGGDRHGRLPPRARATRLIRSSTTHGYE